MKRRESLKVLGSIPFLSFGGINFVEAKQIERSRQAFAASPKNIILVLADGMGVAQWQAGAKWLFFMPWYDHKRTNNPTSSEFQQSTHTNADVDWWHNAWSQPYVLSRDQVSYFR